MHELLRQLIENVHLTGNVRADMRIFLVHHGQAKTVSHSILVAAEAKRLAAKFGTDEALAEVAGLLHDISAVFPPDKRNQTARQLSLDVLPEEDTFPMIIHQKLSAVVAREIFGITNEAALSAISCHTTLRLNASLLDKIVFVADKIKCDQPGEPPYLYSILAALEQSLDQAALCYLDYLWQRRNTLRVVHPWLVAAYKQLSCQ
ncbi:HD domain-containing protein [Candidatus Poribacteria bacterium]|nr:HD domain-containing protein [Candidatus Poribacteria bacterium]